jgi:peptidoglycan/LPS O-acetylase OafA/YrhL
MRSPVPLRAVLARQHLPALDGLRAVFVVAVVVSHFFRDLRILGHLGVGAFFVLSGFLITWLLFKEHDAAGTVSLREFYARRSLRIFPAYYVFLLVAFAVCAALRVAPPPAEVVAALTYTMNIHEAHPVPGGALFASHAWSLAMEEQFYLFWPPAFLILARRGHAPMVAALGLAIAATMVWRSVLHLAVGTGSDRVYFAPDTRIDALLVGCLLAAALRHGRVVAVAEHLAQTWLVAVTVAALMASAWLSPAWHYSVGLTMEALLVAILIVQLMQCSPRPVWSLLESRPARYLGAVSYPLYLYHRIGLLAGVAAAATA